VLIPRAGEAKVGRLIVVSNRVGSFTSVKANEGGLATAIRTAIEHEEAVWFGWSGVTTKGEPGPTRIRREGRLIRMLVDLNRESYERYYAGFSNRLLWPLFHYRANLADFQRDDYRGYCAVNEMFAERLAHAIEPDDVVWIHDYHLIPLGQALRRRGVTRPLGFFLHIPFPTPEVLTTLPVHEELVSALFAYDLVGFQTDKDLLAFSDYVTREAAGRDLRGGVFRAYGSSVRAGAFPISVDPATVAQHAARAVGSNQSRRLQDSLSERDLIIGVDRLDYTKGLPKRFEAIERLLDTHPRYRRGVVVLQIAPPTRGDVPEYQQIRAELDARIGHINGRFGEPDLLPVRYVNRHFSQDSLFGFYRIASVGLVTPLRDGMNLVAKEFVAAQNPVDPGVLVLSRFAGAAREFHAALIVNPYDSDSVVQALDQALCMSLEERLERHRSLMSALRRYDIHRWYAEFLETLGVAAAEWAGDPPPIPALTAAGE
jgi:trehalose 6-phosphate synthase